MSDYVSVQDLRTRQGESDPPIVVDVRGADEYRAGHLPGARHIPLDELPYRLDELPRDRPIVAY